jgi:hypothetical protein
METLLWYGLAAAAATFAGSLLLAKYVTRSSRARHDRGGYTVFALFAIMLAIFSAVLGWMAAQ